MPASAASRFTGPATSFRPRPAGRSGWVSTATGWLRATSAARAGQANSGVPAKMILGLFKKIPGGPGGSGKPLHAIRNRTPGSGSNRLVRGLALLLARLLDSFFDHSALQRRQVVDEYLAVQMVDFVLDAYRQQPVGIEFHRVAVAIQTLDADILGTLDLGILAGNRQAAFLTQLASFAADDFGIDDDLRLVALFAEVEYQNAQAAIDLRGGKPDAARGVHCLEHVVGQSPNRIGDFVDRPGDVAQPRIGKLEYGQLGHGMNFVH